MKITPVKKRARPVAVKKEQHSKTEKNEFLNLLIAKKRSIPVPLTLWHDASSPEEGISILAKVESRSDHRKRAVEDLENYYELIPAFRDMIKSVNSQHRFQHALRLFVGQLLTWLYPDSQFTNEVEMIFGALFGNVWPAFLGKANLGLRSATGKLIAVMNVLYVPAEGKLLDSKEGELLYTEGVSAMIGCNVDFALSMSTRGFFCMWRKKVDSDYQYYMWPHMEIASFDSDRNIRALFSIVSELSRISAYPLEDYYKISREIDFGSWSAICKDKTKFELTSLNWWTTFSKRQLCRFMETDKRSE